MDQVKITKLCNIEIGKTPSRSKATYWGSGTSWVSIRDMKEKYILSTKEEITPKAISETGIKLVPKNTVIMSFKLTVGKVAILSKDMYTNEAIAAFHILDDNELNNRYLYYALQTLRLSENTDRAVMGLTLNKQKLKKLRIPLPPLETQKKIVEVLDKAQALIDARKEQIRLMDYLIQSVFYEMFGDPVTNPKGWEFKELRLLCDVYRGGSPRPIKDFLGGTVPWIKIGDATGGDDVYLDSTKERIIEEGVKKSRLVKKGSLIFANCGVSLGFARIINFEGCIHDGWLSFENIDKSINKIFLLKLLNCYTDYFRNSAPDGTQPNLNTAIMKKFNVIVPPIEIQEKFVERLKIILNQKDNFQNSLDHLVDAYKSIVLNSF